MARKVQQKLIAAATVREELLDRFVNIIRRLVEKRIDLIVPYLRIVQHFLYRARICSRRTKLLKPGIIVFGCRNNECKKMIGLHGIT